MFHANGVNGTAYGAKWPLEGEEGRGRRIVWGRSAEGVQGAASACEGAEVLGARTRAKCLLARLMRQLHFNAQG